MKNLKYKISIFLILTLIFSCQEEDLNFGDIITPTNLVVSYVIQGVDAENPNGDGSGLVILLQAQIML